MLDRPREPQKSKNECHAAWERFPKTQNECHAAWERVFGPHGPDWSPQEGPKKTSQTIYFIMFFLFVGAPVEHLSCAHQKMEQPKWAPKSAQSECSKCCYFPIRFKDLGLLHPLLVHPSFSIRFQNAQKYIGLIHI
jgi:hypothetical protein